MTQEKEFCTIDPPFPMKGYCVSMLVIKSDGKKAMYPLEHIYPTLDEVANDIAHIKHHESQDSGIYNISEICFVIPITFSRRVPLRKEFWDNPDNNYLPDQRIRAFVHSMNKPDLFTLLVTPSKPENDWEFLAAIPLPKSATDSTIEQFMLHSDWPVESTAKYAALYKFEKLQVYNWEAKAVVVKPHIHPYEEFIN